MTGSPIGLLSIVQGYKSTGYLPSPNRHYLQSRYTQSARRTAISLIDTPQISHHHRYQHVLYEHTHIHPPTKNITSITATV